MSKFISPTKYYCDRCGDEVPAYYTLSHLTKGLWVQCPNCGTHPRIFIDNLPLFYKPSKSYLTVVKGTAGGDIKSV